MTETPRPLYKTEISQDEEISVESVRLAAEWLKKEVEDTYHQLGKPMVWSKSQDVVCDMAEEFFVKKIDEAFGAVMKK